eukprot:jgi/Chlat1/4748/Chrsp308S00366
MAVGRPRSGAGLLHWPTAPRKQTATDSLHWWQPCKAERCLTIKDSARRATSAGGDDDCNYDDIDDEDGFVHVDDGYLVVERFKLWLMEPALRPTTLPAVLTTKRVIADFLRLIGRFAMDDLNQKHPTIRKAHVQWCLTVPAIWTDEAKETMQAAAQLPCTANGVGDLKLRKGDQYVVLDVGGGTIDAVAHKVKRDGRIKELAMGIGERCGGTDVDDAFMRFAAEQIPPIKGLALSDPEEYALLMRNWLITKHAFDGIEAPRSVDLPASVALDWFELLKKSADESSLQKLKRSTRALKLSTDDMEECFSEVMCSVFSCLDSMLASEALRNTNPHILLVGGFAESLYLREQMAFDKRVHVPLLPGVAVVHGASLYALNTSKIACRFARRTYVASCARGVRLGDPEEYKFHTDSGWLCRHAYTVLVEKGQLIEQDKPVVSTGSPVSKQQRAITKKVFSTESDPDDLPKYTTDSAFTLLGEFVIPCPDTALGIDRDIETSYYFGRTTIEVEARRINTVADLARQVAVQTSAEL